MRVYRWEKNERNEILQKKQQSNTTQINISIHLSNWITILMIIITITMISSSCKTKTRVKEREQEWFMKR